MFKGAKKLAGGSMKIRISTAILQIASFIMKMIRQRCLDNMLVTS